MTKNSLNFALAKSKNLQVAKIWTTKLNTFKANYFTASETMYSPYQNTIILDKRKSDHTNECITVNNQQIKVIQSLKPLGLRDEMNFNLLISNICKTAVNQLNVLSHLFPMHPFSTP